MAKVSSIPSRLKLSSDSSKQLQFLSQRLNLRRNIICRLAIGRSLRDPESVKSISPKDNDGFEFNRYTLTGDLDNIYRAMIVQHEGERIDDKVYFSTFLRNHIERGIYVLHKEYQRINSPVDFFAELIKLDRVHQYDPDQEAN
ncbi:MAG: DNA sulfur modification protein DndE [Methanocellales archaeon]|nr:DNA sulfur modification protein DndE [Methanocellales archaeon]